MREHGEKFILLPIGRLQLLAGAYMRRDVAEVTNDTEVAVGQRNAMNEPLVVFVLLAVQPAFDAFRYHVRLARFQGVP